jgi:hypothetical protein
MWSIGNTSPLHFSQSNIQSCTTQLYNVIIAFISVLWVFSLEWGVQLSVTKGHNPNCKRFISFTIKITVSGMPKLLNHCVIFIVYVCNLQMLPRPQYTRWWATGWMPMFQVLYKNNAVIALTFLCTVQTAVWFLMWTIMILFVWSNEDQLSPCVNLFCAHYYQKHKKKLIYL